MVNYITPIGSCKPFDKNPNKVNKHIGLARVHSITLHHLETAIGRISSRKFCVSRNNSSGMKGIVVNVYCSKESITKDDIENFFEELNLLLGSMQSSQKLEEELAASRPERRMKAKPYRIPAQRRRA